MTRRRGLRIALIAIGAVALIMIGVVWYAVASAGGARTIVAFALGKMPSSGIKIREVRGPLRGPLYLLGVHYESGGLTADVDSVLVDWRLSRIVFGRLDLERVHASGVRVIFPDSVSTDSARAAKVKNQSSPRRSRSCWETSAWIGWRSRPQVMQVCRTARSGSTVRSTIIGSKCRVTGLLPTSVSFRLASQVAVTLEKSASKARR